MSSIADLCIFIIFQNKHFNIIITQTSFLFLPQREFESVPLSVIQTFVMMVGELNYQNNFLDTHLNNELPFGVLTYIIFIVFVLLMPILLVNLMVSLRMLTDSQHMLRCETKHMFLLFCGCVVDWFSRWRHC